jgi:hypothetical protein
MSTPQQQWKFCVNLVDRQPYREGVRYYIYGWQLSDGAWWYAVRPMAAETRYQYLSANEKRRRQAMHTHPRELS